MKKGFEPSGWASLLAAIPFIALFMIPGALRAAGADPYQTLTLALGQGLVAFFPAVEGYVVSVSGREVFIDLAEKDLLRPGMELQIYRPGREMVHPVNKQVLGTYEQTLGYLTVAEVREKYSQGLFVEAVTGVVAGDRVRISARRLRALLSFSGKAGGIEIGPLAQALAGRGEQSGRFQMIDEPKWASTLTALGITLDAVLADPAALRSLGSRVPADLLLLVRLEEQGGKRAVALAVRSLHTGASLAEIREPWPDDAAAVPQASPVAVVATGPAAPATVPAAGPGAAPAPEAASQSPEGEYLTRELTTPQLYLAVGDILGEGRREVVLSDGRDLSLYRWEKSGLVWKWNEEGAAGRRVLDLQAGDVDGDGRTEVLVTSVARGFGRTEVRAWRKEKLDVVAVADGLYLRLARRPGAATVIFGQRAGVGEVLAGRVEEYRWQEGTFARIEGSSLPHQVGIFGLAVAPVAGKDAVVALDRDGFLNLFTPEGRGQWRSGRQYGGYPPRVSASELFGAAPMEDAIFEEEARALQGRMIAAPAGDALRVIVPRNFTAGGIVMPRQRILGQGEIVILEGLPTDLEEVRRTRAFDGYIADLAAADLEGDSRPEIVFLVNRRSGYFLGEKGKLVVWTVP